MKRYIGPSNPSCVHFQIAAKVLHNVETSRYVRMTMLQPTFALTFLPCIDTSSESASNCTSVGFLLLQKYGSWTSSTIMLPFSSFNYTTHPSLIYTHIYIYSFLSFYYLKLLQSYLLYNKSTQRLPFLCVIMNTIALLNV